MIEEDRLLSRIDILENKLLYLQKNVTDDKLRDEMMKLLEEKCVYQVNVFFFQIQRTHRKLTFVIVSEFCQRSVA